MTFSLDPAAANGVIDPMAYGANHHDISIAPFRRFGGNRATSYNWEANQSNAGNDFNHQSDYWLLSQVGLPQNGSQASAAVPVYYTNQFRAQGSVAELITIQAAGYVAADGSGIVTAGETAPSARWKQVVAHKPGWPGTLLLAPDKTDGVAYMDEQVNYLVNQFGPASAGGIKYYSVDNEPGLWPSTHPRIHPSNPTYAEVYARATTTASAILDIDASAGIFAPASYGWAEYMNMQSATDAGVNNATYGWFLSYYLDKMRQTSVSQGRRLLHYLDLHWYPEATGSGVRITFGNPDNTTQLVSEARMAAPRSLWDTTYTETSWITSSQPAGDKPIRLIPRVKASINTYYPGTKLCLSEYSYGAPFHISGGIAQADVLGILGRYGVAGNYWHLNGAKNYVDAAYRLYRNYDGAGAKFGDLSFSAQTTDTVYTSVYASKDSLNPLRLTVVALNKNWATVVTGNFNLALSGQSITQVKGWRFDSASSTLSPIAAPAFGASSFSDTLPQTSATVYEITLSSAGSPTFTPTRTPALSPTYTRSSTASPSSTPSRSATATPSVTSTRSSTRSPTLTPTLSASASDSPSPTQSPTSSATRSATLSPSATATHSVTGTRSATATVTPTRSQSLTPSLSPSATSTPSATRTYSATASPSYTATRSATRSWSPTLSSTPSMTATPTATETDTPVPPGSTLTATPSQSPLFSASPTHSGTPSQNPSVTLSSSASASPSATASPSASPSSSPTPTPTPSLSATPSRSSTSSPSGTASPSASASPSVSASPSASASASASPSPSPSASVSVSPMDTATPTLLPSASDTQTPTALPSALATATASPSATSVAAPALGLGELKIEEGMPAPNPNPKAMALKLAGQVEGVSMKIYSPAMALVAELEWGAAGPGWVVLPVDLKALGLGNGRWHYRAVARRAGAQSGPLIGTLVLLN